MFRRPRGKMQTLRIILTLTLAVTARFFTGSAELSSFSGRSFVSTVSVLD
jgi:hypothetical protein